MTKPAAGSRPSMDLHDYVHELTRQHQHREHYTVRLGQTWYGQHHTTDVPPLLAQLQAASPSGAVDERDNSGYGSRPAARLEALDTLHRIDDEAARWVRFLGHDDPGNTLDPKTGRPVAGSGTTACVRLLASLVPQLDRDTHAAILRDVRRWWTWARIVSGWDSPAWRPDNTCPMCGERRTLRVNLAAEVAFCVHDPCRETWDSSNIGLLADHIREESSSERVPPPTSVPCQCALPRAEALAEQGRWGLCPNCGSSVCVNAEAVAAAEQARRAAARENASLEQLEQITVNYQRWLRATARARPRVRRAAS